MTFQTLFAGPKDNLRDLWFLFILRSTRNLSQLWKQKCRSHCLSLVAVFDHEVYESGSMSIKSGSGNRIHARLYSSMSVPIQSTGAMIPHMSKTFSTVGFSGWCWILVLTTVGQNLKPYGVWEMQRFQKWEMQKLAQILQNKVGVFSIELFHRNKTENH